MRSEWEEMYLSKIADIQTGPFGNQLHKKDYVQVGTPIVTVEHLGNKFFSTQNLPQVSHEDKERLSKYTLLLGDIVFSRVGSVDRCSYVGQEYAGWMFSGRCLRIRPKNGLIESEFLYYYLIQESEKQFIRNIAVGATMPSINTTLLGKILVRIPPVEKQRAIAAMLSCLDDKIELNKKINANLEAQAKAIFKSWFLDFEPFRDGEFVDSELGPIPKSWKVGQFTSIVSVLGGGTPKTGNPSYWNGIVPFFTPKDVVGGYTLTTEKYLSAEGLKNCNSQLYPVNTVFITARGTVGKLALAGTDMAMNQSCYALAGKEGYNQLFVYELARQVVDSLKHKSSGAVFNAIVTRDFDSEYVIIPEKKIVAEFTQIVSPLFSLILNNTKQNFTMAALRDTLLPKLMSGEIEVPVAEEMIQKGS